MPSTALHYKTAEAEAGPCAITRPPCDNECSDPGHGEFPFTVISFLHAERQEAGQGSLTVAPRSVSLRALSRPALPGQRCGGAHESCPRPTGHRAPSVPGSDSEHFAPGQRGRDRERCVLVSQRHY